MEMENRGDLVINGFGSSNGGHFHHVTINGKGTINNDVECVEFECNGSGTVQGTVKANSAEVNGMAKILGNVNGQKLTVDGAAKIEQSVSVKKLKVSGKATVGGAVKAEDVVIKGRLTVEEDCEAETFKAESLFKIGGLLNAETIDIKLFGDCQAKEIGGETILVKKNKGSSLFGIFKPVTQLETDLIEGNKIEIEYTNAKVVRGNRIKIGPNCNIGLIEYTDELIVDKKASISESRKV
jgi:cytoskeletal protein CcmA (bactofilin family)